MSDVVSSERPEVSEPAARPKRFIVITDGPNRYEQDRAFRRGEEVTFVGRFSESPNYYRQGDEEVIFSAKTRMFYPDSPAEAASIWNVQRQKSTVIADIGGRIVSLTLHYEPGSQTGHTELPLNW